jgi:hypothetical protein
LGKTQVGRNAPIAVPRDGDYLDLFAITPEGTVVSTTNRKVDIVYLADPTSGMTERSDGGPPAAALGEFGVPLSVNEQKKIHAVGYGLNRVGDNA